ncbi:aldehyde dehydrogenase family protein [Actinomycetospora sp. TBRC 11914]|uniref:aldehyde dehydrogenase family protein n=1 Tax=Actinomycetospora sp. TBRC 11914 TaxID=2729387 RepID=UPI00145E2771|nr:aldehyde dehydrogenase family protein [Actinomycetospora sp. TBRC 11914]NMO91602.1 aldehyde dehydrogenase family protein [Actinomycetospora sp. TBRC 11914]
MTTRDPGLASPPHGPATATVPPPTDGSVLEIRCPADGSVAGSVAVDTPADVAAAAARLRAAQPAWEALGPKGRAKHVLRWLDWILDNQERLVRLAQEESGKSWGDASFETLVATEVINYYTKHAEAFLAPRSARPHGPASLTKKLVAQPRPHQLVGIITPWNGPIGTQAMDAIPALIAGAAVLSKPSEVTPLSWTELTRAWHEEIGAPPVLETVNGRGETGAAVVDEVDMVAFTGSTATGRRIAARAGERLIPASLELGGKDPMIVLADADLDRAVGAAVWGGMHNAGQACISVERVYVEASVHDEFVAKLVEKVAALRVGKDAPASYETDIGAMATPAQLDIVERHVQDALARGARVLTGGRRRDDGLFYEPTVLVDVDHSMACMREETFGPTLPVMRVDDAEAALRLANDSPYGLSSSLWTKDADRAQTIARRIESGSVNINNALMSAFQFPLPMGGWKSSGVGSRFGGASGLLKYCRQQAVVSERIALPGEPHWYPYVAAKSLLQAKAFRFLGAHDWRRRLGRTPR